MAPSLKIIKFLVKYLLFAKISNPNRNTHLNVDTKDTQTTTKSSTLNADLKKAPLCKNTPYEIVFNNNSIENIVVKK